MSTTPPLWTPSDPSHSQTTLFRQHVNAKYSLQLETYEDLWRWSCRERSAFWSEVWDWHGVIGDKGAPSHPCSAHSQSQLQSSSPSNPQSQSGAALTAYVDETLPPSANPEWFTNASLNWAENQLRHHVSHPDDIALIQISEPCPSYPSPPTIRITQKELYGLVGQLQWSMKAAGVKRGDRIAFWGGNTLEAVVVLLSTSSLGGIFSSAAADFGVDGVVERLNQIRPKLLFVTNGVVYNGVERPLLPLVKPMLDRLAEGLERVVVIEHLPGELVPGMEGVGGYVKGKENGKKQGDAEGRGEVEVKKMQIQMQSWESFLGEGDGKDGVVNGGEVEFVRMGFNEPIWILFSSGTTGKPKAIVHRQGGMLVDSLREHHLAGDIGRGDVYFYYTTPGWMMFQYLVSGLATGATIVTYEGSPLKRPEMMWEVIDRLGVTVFGTSAKYIEQISKHYPNVKDNHSLSTLRQILSTGSPLPPHLFDFVYQHVKSGVLLGSVTGGTDICSVFAGRNTCLPVYRGEIQSRMLGFALDVAAVEPGLPGELICTQAFPIQPIGFWPLPAYGFPEEEVASAQQRFQESYFKDAEGRWYHGDYVQITPSQSGNGGGLIMLGRSDGVLNPGGIRFGPTDIYSVLENDEFSKLGIEETLVVGLMVEGGADEKVILFVKMRAGREMGADLVKKIKTSIRVARSARHVPAKILQVGDVPVTLTGKKVEVPIRKVINGAPVESINPATLRNPECLAEYVSLGKKMRLEEGM